MGRHRREIQSAVGVSVWIDGEDAYAYRKPSGVQAEAITRPIEKFHGLDLFVLREALVEHCRALGSDAWIARAGELQVLGLTPHQIEDRFRIDYLLQLRIGTEAYVPDAALLTARQRTAWRCVDPLSNPELAKLAANQRAVRLEGNGPRRGLVLRAAGSSATLRVGREEIEVMAEHYTLAANAAFVSSWRGSVVLRKMRVSGGDLTVGGKRNQHAIEDRFKLAGDAFRRLGGKIDVAGDCEVAIARAPVQVRLEDRT